MSLQIRPDHAPMRCVTLLRCAAAAVTTFLFLLLGSNSLSANYICPEAEALKKDHDDAYNSWFAGEAVSSEEVARLQGLWFASKSKCIDEQRAEEQRLRERELYANEGGEIEALLNAENPLEVLRIISSNSNQTAADRESMRRRIGNERMERIDTLRLSGAEGMLRAQMIEGSLNLIHSTTDRNLARLESTFDEFFDSTLGSNTTVGGEYSRFRGNARDALSREEWEIRNEALWNERRDEFQEQRLREEQERLEEQLRNDRMELYRQAQLERADQEATEGGTFSTLLGLLNKAVELKSIYDRQKSTHVPPTTSTGPARSQSSGNGFSGSRGGSSNCVRVSARLSRCRTGQ